MIGDDNCRGKVNVVATVVPNVNVRSMINGSNRREEHDHVVPANMVVNSKKPIGQINVGICENVCLSVVFF